MKDENKNRSKNKYQSWDKPSSIKTLLTMSHVAFYFSKLCKAANIISIPQFFFFYFLSPLLKCIAVYFCFGLIYVSHFCHLCLKVSNSNLDCYILNLISVEFMECSGCITWLVSMFWQWWVLFPVIKCPQSQSVLSIRVL